MNQSTKRKFLRTALCGLVAGFCLPTSAAHAADEGYPSRPIKFVVPYTAGGSNDVVGRVLAQKLSTYWGVPIIVEGRQPGRGAGRTFRAGRLYVPGHAK